MLCVCIFIFVYLYVHPYFLWYGMCVNQSNCEPFDTVREPKIILLGRVYARLSPLTRIWCPYFDSQPHRFCKGFQSSYRSKYSERNMSNLMTTAIISSTLKRSRFLYVHGNLLFRHFDRPRNLPFIDNHNLITQNIYRRSNGIRGWHPKPSNQYSGAWIQNYVSIHMLRCPSEYSRSVHLWDS